MARLAGRTAIVTGGAKGIGRHYTKALAGEGARVMIADVADGSDLVQELDSAHGQGTALSCVTDVSDEQAVKDLVARTIDSFGKIDILVNNAAMFVALHEQPFTEIDVALWDRVMAVNVLPGIVMAVLLLIYFGRPQPGDAAASGQSATASAANVLRGFGVPSVAEGAEIVLKVQTTERGRQAVERDGQLIMVDDDRYPLEDGEQPKHRSVRFRTLGCYPLTAAVASRAENLDDLLAEMLVDRRSERSGRLIDGEGGGSMESKKTEGYF